jgi:hypothetical protein
MIEEEIIGPQPEEVEESLEAKLKQRLELLAKIRPYWRRLLIGFLGFLIFFGAVYALQQIQWELILPQPSPTPTPLPTEVPQEEDPTAEWKMYVNREYWFRIKYSFRYQLEEDLKPEEFYDQLASFSLPSDTSPQVSLKAIGNIDVYEANSPRFVVEREISDAPHGGNYSVSEIRVSDYEVALARINYGGFEGRGEELIAIIAHPDRNLFIEIESRGDYKEFDLILSTFRFIKEFTKKECYENIKRRLAQPESFILLLMISFWPLAWAPACLVLWKLLT